MKKYFLQFSLLAALSLMMACEKKFDGNADEVSQKPQFRISISDARVNQESTKKTEESDIIDPAKLTTFILQFEGIYLKTSAGEYVSVTKEPFEVDLRAFRGTVKELVPVEIEAGTYTAVKTVLSGVSVSYDGNNYTADQSSASVQLNNIEEPFTQNISNPFEGEGWVHEEPKNFIMGDGVNFRSLRLLFDAEASCKVVPIDVPVLGTYEFAAMRTGLGAQAILEEGIQQIRYSPPTIIRVNSIDDIDYYGIHTFKDFHQEGGTINSHSSQHVFRGEDGSLLIEAEAMAVNESPLSITDVSATETTDTRSDEIFKFLTFASNLSQQGYELESGKVYYFSLRKTWNITTDGQTYDLTRICEPIPVYWP